MDSIVTAITVNKVKHLCQSANTLPASTAQNILKSYYLTKCRAMTLSGRISLPKRFTSSTIRCPRCCVQYEETPTAFKIQPERKKSRFARRLLKKSASGENITRFQEVYLKNLIRKRDVDTHNNLVMTCGVCKRVTNENLQKPERLDIGAVDEMATQNMSKSCKKKKKKDRFSGLNKEAVLSASPHNKSFSTSHFMPLQATPVTKSHSERKEKVHKKNLFVENKQNSKISKKSKEKERKKNLKGLQNMLNSPKQKKSPSATLKHFLTTI